MRFGLIHRIMTDALAALGVLALVTSGELDRWVSALVLLGLVAALLVPERLHDLPSFRRLSVVAPVALLAVEVARLTSGAELLSAALEFALGLQVIRLITRRGAAHDQQVIVLALIHLIAGTVLGGGLAYGLCFLGFLVLAPGALVLSHLRREVEGNYRQGARDRTGLPVDVPRILRSKRVIGRSFLIFTCLMSVPIFVFTAVLFVLFPRVGLSVLFLNHSRPERMVGFSDKVDLGGVGKLRTDPTIVLRVEVPDLPDQPPPRLALYLKGSAFDTYDGRSWARSGLGERRPVERRGKSVRLVRFPDRARDRILRIDLEPIDPPVVFLPSDAVALTLITLEARMPVRPPELFVGPEGGLTYKNPGLRGLRYEVSLAGIGDAARSTLSPSDRARYLSLPDDVTPRVHALARRWTQGITDPQEQAKRIEARLRRQYRYDLESPSGAAANPLDHFLFESKRGHCEFYSTAMAVLLRSIGVPSRNVTGFIGGSYNRFANTYAVRQGDAHSWVEVYLPDQGWTRFDPTPPSSSAPRSEMHGWVATARDLIEALALRWDRHVVGYDLKQQISLFQRVRDGYRGMLPKHGLLARIFGDPRRAILVLSVVALAAWLFFRYRRRRSFGPGAVSRKSSAPNAERVVELYRSLERAMAARGAGRTVSTPPLTHARGLRAVGHPIADEVLDLTQRYQAVRFGGAPFTETDRREFRARIHALQAPPRREAPAP